MKSCPECGTRYEDYVENCLIDGEELELLVEKPLPAAAAEEQEKPGGSSMVVLLLIPILLLLLVVGGGVVYLIASPGDPPPPVPAPVVAPTPPPEPVVVPVPVTIPTLALVTTPSGASVTENGMEVCKTPCSVPHPLEASLPRTFTFRLDKHQDGTLVVEKVAGPYLIELKPTRGPRPPPRPVNPTPTPTPSPTPNPTAPKLGRER